MQRIAQCTANLPAAVLRAALSTAAQCSCASIQELKPAAPGTVSPYNHHVFIRSAPPEDLALPETSGQDSLWWPSVVEKCVAYMASPVNSFIQCLFSKLCE